MHLGIRVQARDEPEQVILSCLSRQFMQPAVNAGLFTGFALVAHIDLAGGIVADQDRGQPRSNAAQLDKSGRLGGDFCLHGLRELFAIE